MIGQVRGTALDGPEGALIVDCGGVGYEVIVTDRVRAEVVPNTEITLLTRLIVREDAWTLYGFRDAHDRRLFDHLLGVSGVGPKAALALLGTLEPEDLAIAIAGGDARALTRAPGIGLRTAERIVVDLKEKMAAAALESKATGRGKTAPKAASPADELLDALLALGYRRSDAEAAAEKAREAGIDGVPAQIRFALRELRR